MGVLEGKVAIITGAARGQGAAEGRLFHAEGASLVLTDRDERGAALAEELGPNVVFLTHDVADEERWKTVAGTARERFGKIDILINNAGITGYESVETLDRATLNRYLDIHLYGALFGIQAVIPHIPESGGAIINIASAAGMRAHAGYAGYGVSKWALRALSRHAALDLAGRNIRVNAVMPGGVETPMLTQSAGAELIDAARAAVPMKRFATAEEIARTVLFLASDASSYLTGAELVIDGGLLA